MAHEQLYRQCKMEKQVETGKKIHMAWIPSQFAKLGKTISLKKADDSWSTGWRVVFVGGTKTQESIDAQRDAQKRWESVIK